MPVIVAQTLVMAFGAYLLAGLLLLPWWWLIGLRRLDTAAGQAAWTTKLLWAPGLVALWPWLIHRGWRGDGHPPAESNAHRRASRARPPA
jgi:hypothetical protein